MEYTVDIVVEHEYAVITTWGEATIDGFHQTIRALGNHPDWKPGTNVLLDHRRLNASHLTMEDIRKIAAPRSDLPAFVSIRRVASVVRGDVEFGLMRMWDSFIDERYRPDHRIFRTIHEARAWLEEASGSKD